MGYYIDYGERTHRTEIPDAVKGKDYSMIWFLLVMCVCLYLFHASGDQGQAGATDVTKRAAVELVADLKKGESMKVAFKEFCLEIIEDGENKTRN